MPKFKDSTVRWGVIGAGDVCEVKSVPAMQLITKSEVVAVMRRNSDKAADFARRHNISKWYDRDDDIIEDPAVNAIYIATPPDSHAYLTKKAAAAGKAVYVEKPMGRTYKECREMVKACQITDTPLFVAYYRRSLPVFQKVRELIVNGSIGDVRSFNILYNSSIDQKIDTADNNWRVKPEIAGGGYFYDKASHQIDLLDFIFGPIDKLTGITTNQAGLYSAEDNVVAIFKYSTGITGAGSWCFTSAECAVTDQIVIIGSKGRITFPVFSDYHIVLQTDREVSTRFDFNTPQHIQYPLIESIVYELLGTGMCPSSGESGARTNQIMEKIFAS